MNVHTSYWTMKRWKKAQQRYFNATVSILPERGSARRESSRRQFRVNIYVHHLNVINLNLVISAIYFLTHFKPVKSVLQTFKQSWICLGGVCSLVTSCFFVKIFLLVKRHFSISNVSCCSMTIMKKWSHENWHHWHTTPTCGEKNEKQWRKNEIKSLGKRFVGTTLITIQLSSAICWIKCA